MFNWAAGKPEKSGQTTNKGLLDARNKCQKLKFNSSIKSGSVMIHFQSAVNLLSSDIQA